jgi:cobyrinic acid a,c-diamide synthase
MKTFSKTYLVSNLASNANENKLRSHNFHNSQLLISTSTAHTRTKKQFIAKFQTILTMRFQLFYICPLLQQPYAHYIFSTTK